MKNLLRNVKRNVSGIKRVLSNKWALVGNKTKKGLLTGTFVLAIGLTTILGACSNQQAPVVPDTSQEQVSAGQQLEQDNEKSDQETGETEVGDDDLFDFISDQLDIENLDMVSEDNTQEKAEQITPADDVVAGAVDENGNEINVPSGDVGKEIIEDVKVDDNYFVDPDGNVWTSEEEYRKFIESQKEDSNSNSNEVVAPDFDGYIAPDGSFWESEEEYQKYVKSLEEQASNENTAPAENTNQSENANDVGQGETTPAPAAPADPYADSFKDPDGNYWVSEQDYLDYINGSQSDVGQDSYYVAPDGSYWESEADYNEYVKSLGGEATLPVEPPAPTVPEETNENNYYVDDEGNYWASYEDYLEFIGQDSVGGKTR